VINRARESFYRRAYARQARRVKTLQLITADNAEHSEYRGNYNCLSFVFDNSFVVVVSAVFRPFRGIPR
jgi:hypothetical protein